MDRADLLLEIGSEEIPAGYLDRAAARLREKVCAFLAEKGLDFAEDGVETFAAPRRIALLVPSVALATPRRSQVRLGPAVQAAFDAGGRPTKAAEGFARSLGVPVESLERFEDAKGERLGRKVETGGEALPDLLLTEGLLRSWVTQLGFPKVMRWIPGDDLSYARPIRWIVCLLGQDVVPMRLAHLTAGRHSRGHRTLAPGPVEIPDARAYEAALEAAAVLVRPARRRSLIEGQARALAAGTGGRLVEDEGLLEEVVHLAEHPTGIRGAYDRSLVEVLPREVIVTAMRAHQRYFSVEDDAGRLIPCFLTFRDGGEQGLDNVRAGNERVLRARLDDALFYWNEDRSIGSEEKVARLDSVVWLEGFGSVGERCRRTAELAVALADAIGAEADRGRLHRAALLCKSDLATEMIKDGKEFTKLQGTMGRYYALAAGEDPEVADAIAEHLRPRFAEDALPEGVLGTLVGLADRLDAIAGCVLAGFAPTGSQDPYALRRQTLAVLRILVERGWNLDLEDWIARSVAAYSVAPADAARAVATMTDLFWGRLETFLGELPGEIVRAVLSVHRLDPVDNVQAARALAGLQGSQTFAQLREGAVRCRNILVKADRLSEEQLGPQDRAHALRERSRTRWEGGELGAWSPEDFAEAAEQELVRRAQAGLPRLDRALRAGDWSTAYASLAELGPAIDTYFTEVLVNAPDPEVRRRRLDWLESLHYLFARFADLSRLPSP